MWNLSKAVAVMAVATLGLSGCATMSNSELVCLVGIVGGAIVGAELHEDEEKGALIGAAVGALGCGIYKYLNGKQVAEMVEKETIYLSAVPLEEPIDIEFALTPNEGEESGPIVRLSAERAVAASTLLGDGEEGYCRPIRTELRPGGGREGEPQVYEQTKCLNAEGDWVPRTAT